MPTPLRRKAKSSASGSSWTPRVRFSDGSRAASRQSSVESTSRHSCPTFDVGDHVVVVNAAKVHLTGRKLHDKQYRWHSGYIGGLREVRAETMLRTHPERVIEWAVQGMMPKKPTREGHGEENEGLPRRHASTPAQQPETLTTKAAAR